MREKNYKILYSTRGREKDRVRGRERKRGRENIRKLKIDEQKNVE